MSIPIWLLVLLVLALFLFFRWRHRRLRLRVVRFVTDIERDSAAYSHLSEGLRNDVAVLSALAVIQADPRPWPRVVARVRKFLG